MSTAVKLAANQISNAPARRDDAQAKEHVKEAADVRVAHRSATTCRRALSVARSTTSIEQDLPTPIKPRKPHTQEYREGETKAAANERHHPQPPQVEPLGAVLRAAISERSSEGWRPRRTG